MFQEDNTSARKKLNIKDSDMNHEILPFRYNNMMEKNNSDQGKNAKFTHITKDTSKNMNAEKNNIRSLLHEMINNFKSDKPNDEVKVKIQRRRMSHCPSLNEINRNTHNFENLFEKKNLKKKSQDDNEEKEENDGKEEKKKLSSTNIKKDNIRTTIRHHIDVPLSTMEILTMNKSQIIEKMNEKKKKFKRSLLLFNSFDEDNKEHAEKVNTNEITHIMTNNEDLRKLRRMKRVDDSVSGEDDEEIVNMNESKFIIDLDSPFKHYWDILISIFTFYTILVTPYVLAFIDDDSLSPLTILECVMDFIFIIDVMLQFFIPYYNKNEIYVKNLSIIARNYLFGWFLIDLVASIPGSLILIIINSGGNSSGNNLRISTINKAARLTKFYKMIKFTKLFKVIKFSNARKNKQMGKFGLDFSNNSSSVQRLLRFFINFILVSHMITCIWIFLGNQINPSWVTERNFQDSDVFELYVASLYFHWTTIYTIGYGDILSFNITERLYNCILLFIGVFIYSFTVSQIGNIISTNDTFTNRHLKNLEVLENLQKKYKIPSNFYNKVYRFLNHNYKFNKNQRYVFIKDLPPKLRNDLLFEMYHDVINNFSFFTDNKNPDFTSKVLFCMKPLRIYRKEVLVTEGNYMEEVLFVKKGTLSINLSAKYDEFKLIDIKRNEHFGDILVLSNQRSPVNIKVSSKVADLYIISKEDLIEISKEFPETLEDIFLYSSYNFSSLMELIELKKKDFEEKNRHKEEIYFDKTNVNKHLVTFELEDAVPFFKEENKDFIEGGNPNMIAVIQKKEDQKISEESKKTINTDKSSEIENDDNNDSEDEVDNKKEIVNSEESKNVSDELKFNKEELKNISEISNDDAEESKDNIKEKMDYIEEPKEFLEKPIDYIEEIQFNEEKIKFNEESNDNIEEIKLFPTENKDYQNIMIDYSPEKNSVVKNNILSESIKNIEEQYMESLKENNKSSDTAPKNLIKINFFIQNNSYITNNNDPNHISYQNNSSSSSTTSINLDSVTQTIDDIFKNGNKQNDIDIISEKSEEDEIDSDDPDKNKHENLEDKNPETNIISPIIKSNTPVMIPKMRQDSLSPPVTRNNTSNSIQSNTLFAKRIGSGNLNKSKLQKINPEKFRRSSVMVSNITNNIKEKEQIEQNPHEFFVNEFKDILYNQIEKETLEQEKKNYKYIYENI